MKKLFKVLKDIGATDNYRKCMFFPKEIEYGRFIIDKIEAHINPNKIKVIMKPP